MSDQQDTNPIALSFRKVALHEGVRHEDFEKFMLEELFPTIDTSANAIDTSANGFAPDQHFLLQEDWPSDVYVWMSRLEYSVHQTPFPQWLTGRLSDMYENAQGKLEPFGSYTENTLDIAFDVASMGGRFS
jgi:hypothetical protein